MRGKKMRAFLKWTSYVLFALVLFCFQSAPERLGLFSDVIFLLPFVIAFACYEEMIPSVIMASVCGLFFDYSVQRIFGYNALVLCILCFFVSFAMKYFIRPVFLGVVVSIFAASFVYCIVDFFFFFVLKGYEEVGTLILSNYLPLFLKTGIFGILIAFVVKKIYDLSPLRAKFDNN
ncbi:MAG: hypothetical protein E7539_03570 [Ruminococcaceae bacterium]|nr:hypothetical protein [Oscillospiraceae bacterium]